EKGTEERKKERKIQPAENNAPNGRRLPPPPGDAAAAAALAAGRPAAGPGKRCAAASPRVETGRAGGEGGPAVFECPTENLSATKPCPLPPCLFRLATGAGTEVEASAGAPPAREPPTSGMVTVFSDPVNFNVVHPLHHAWTLWYDNPAQKTAEALWSQNLKELITFDTVEEFWGVYNNVVLASNLPVGATYHFFKRGIMPMWEDPANEKGGRWTVQYMRRIGEEVSQQWLNAVCARSDFCRRCSILLPFGPRGPAVRKAPRKSPGWRSLIRGAFRSLRADRGPAPRVRWRAFRERGGGLRGRPGRAESRLPAFPLDPHRDR
ncbi:MAG: translation initiation factor eIF 4e-like domain-containing protein, partial [Olpidium bornovanus]